MAVGTVSTAWAVFSVLGGTVLGSSISIFVAFYTQKRSLDAAKRQRDEDRFERRKAIAYSLFFKMIRIHSNISIIDNSLSDFVKGGTAKGLKTLWQMILPLGNMPDRVKFTPDEMALLLSLDSNLFNDLGPYDDIHNSLLDIYQTYGDRRAAALSKFGTEKMDGATGTHALSKEEVEWLTPRAYEMNSIAEDMIARAREDTKESRLLLERMHTLFVKEFSFEPHILFKEPS